MSGTDVGQLHEPVADGVHHLGVRAQDAHRHREVVARLGLLLGRIAGAGWSTPAYSTPWRAMNSLRTVQNSGAFMGQGEPWLLLSYLP